jgi:anti-anti-sigma regulatory factor
MDGADIHLDLSGLSFCDISGIRSLVDAAENRRAGRLMLHGLPDLLQTVMNVTGWSGLPNLQLCNCEVGR